MREWGLMPGLELQIAHVNYGLRGEESENDETFVRELGATLGVPVSCERLPTALQPGQTLQEAAREARYTYFDRLRRELGLTSVATGHTADDQAETLLLWLLRGAGTGGLAGIPVTRRGGIIRPLLGVTREQVVSYLSSRGATYRSDSTNATLAYRRNRIRHEVLPLLRAFNPRIVEGLAREAEILAADASILEEVERERWQVIVKEVSSGRVVIDNDRLATQPMGLQRRLLRRALAFVRGKATGLTFRHVDDIVDRVVGGSPGAGLNLPGNVRVERDGDLLTVVKSLGEKTVCAGMEWMSGIPLPIPGDVRVGYDGRRLFAVEGTAQPLNRETGGSVFVGDADKLKGPLTVRSWKRGDWFCPVGMGGHRKKLQDFFVDEKIRRSQRDGIPLVVAPAGIVWVAGYRGDERFVAGTTTTRFVTLSLVKE
jgi:tRNA(Ile)-lysidine synthase